MEVYYWWLIMAGFFMILELATEGFLVCWFGIGALGAMIVSFFAPENLLLQLIVFVLLSIILVLSTRKLTKKVTPKDVPSNVYTILGKEAIVITEIDNINSKGQIKIDGDIWSARSDTSEVIPVNSKVEILRIEGVKAIVKLKN